MMANNDKSKIKILIADDEVIIGFDLQDRIRDLGYSVCGIAKNGEEALALAEAERPDLVLMDVVLRGGLEGIDVADRLRSRFGIPVVFLTAYSDEEKIERAKRTIPFGYVLKPFETRELKIAIEMALFAARADVERKKALEALKASEKKYRLIAENVRDVIFTMDMNLRYTYVSPSAYYVRGYQPSEALNLNPAEALTPESLVTAVNAIAEELEAENNPDSDPDRARMIEMGLVGKDGSTVWVEALCSFLRDENGRPTGILGVGRVISDRKRLEDELRKSEERYRELYLRAPTGIFEVDFTTGTFTSVNPAMCEFMGYTEAEMLSMGPFQVLTEESQKHFISRLEKLAAGIEVPTNPEFQIRDKFGHIRWVQLNVEFKKRDGQTYGAFVVVHDIDELKQSQKQLMESREAYRALVDGLPDIVMRFDREARHLFVSNNVMEIVELPVDRFIGRTHRELGFSEDLCRLWEEAIFKVFESGYPYESEFTFSGKKGPTIFDWRLTPEFDEQGRVKSVLSISRDVTAQRKVEGDYRMLFQEMLDGFALHEVTPGTGGNSADYRFLAVNPAFERLTGLKKDDIVGRTVLEVLPDAAPGWIETYGRVAFTGKPVSFESYQAELDKHFEVKVFQPASNQFASICTDITERKRAEDALKKYLEQSQRREREIRGLFEASQAVIQSSGFEEAARRVFDACRKATGAVSGYVALLSPDDRENEVLFLESGGLPCGVDPSLPMPIRGLRAEAYAKAKVVYENDFMKSRWAGFMPLGHVKMRNVMFAPLTIGGKVVGVIGLANKPGDFTEEDARAAAAFGDIAAVALQRARAEETLRVSEERFRLTYNTSPDAVNINRLDNGIYVDMNDGFTHLTGFTRDDVIGRSSLDINIWHDTADRQKLVAGLREKGYYENLEAKFRRKDGSLATGLMSARVIPFKGIPHIISITRDISAFKEADETRRRLEIQLQQAQKMEAVGTLAGGVAHDFNNLLQAINGYTQMLLMGKPEYDPEYANLMAIHEAGKRAAVLVRQLLLFSRKAESERRPIALNDVVEEAGKILKRTIPKMVDVAVRTHTRLWSIIADPVQIEQILLNLGSNASDAMPEGGRLVIETDNVTLDEEFARTHLGAEPGAYVLLSVTDTGHGMTEETKTHIFEPFYTTKEIGQGTGLGLASVYGIVKSHGGYIDYYSEIGLGTTFRIYLPAVAPAFAASTQDTDTGPLLGGSETILLVDDEDAIRDFAAQALRRFGYRVTTAPNGEEALEIYAGQMDGIDMVVMDLGMPGMGGYKCLRELLRIDPSVKVLIASGYSMNSRIKNALDAGASGFVGKPYQLAELLKWVRKVLDKDRT